MHLHTSSTKSKGAASTKGNNDLVVVWHFSLCFGSETTAAVLEYL